MTFPKDPIAAVTHANPYPYYADLVARAPIYYDETLGLWVASGAAAVTVVLQSDQCKVRPAAEPVPKALLGSPAADIFRYLIRMNVGAGHCPFNRAVSATLDSIAAARITEGSRKWARFLFDEIEPRRDAGRLTDFAFRLSVYVIGSLLGVSDGELPRIASSMGEFVRCVAPGSSADQIERGKRAAGDLLETFRALFRAAPADGLLAILAREARRVGREDRDVIVGNGIGFLSQAYEATAGLIGNTLLALAAHRELCERIKNDPEFLRDVIQEVLRYDPPTHNTRRFLVRDGIVAGRKMKQGDAVLVCLAAANRDPAANAGPEHFDPLKKDRRLFTFGVGIHACPGAALANAIAQAGVAQVLEPGGDFTKLTHAVTYRVSANTRIPLFGN
jgi:cytochrome P450